jgi:hypothetical protein
VTLKAALAGLLAALGIAGCGGAISNADQGVVQTTASPHARTQGGRPSHIAVILMENEEYGSIVGASSTPYINSLARRYALATSMYAISHPSLPNYLALTGGSTFGISSDCTGCTVGATSLVDQLDHARVSWKAYMEDLPGRCFTGAGAGDYAKKHDPFVYYTPVTDDPARCAHVVSLNQLYPDERSHATGDRFLATLVPGLLRALGPRGLLFITWDEGSSDAGCCRLASGGHIATIVAGPAARPGARMRTPTDHYSLLQTVEDLLGLPRLRGAACRCTPSLQPLLRGG